MRRQVMSEGTIQVLGNTRTFELIEGNLVKGEHVVRTGEKLKVSEVQKMNYRGEERRVCSFDADEAGQLWLLVDETEHRVA